MSEPDPTVSSQPRTPGVEGPQLLRAFFARGPLLTIWAILVLGGFVYVLVLQDELSISNSDLKILTWFFLFLVFIVELPALVAVVRRRVKNSVLLWVHVFLLAVTLIYWLILMDSFVMNGIYFSVPGRVAYDTHLPVFRLGFAALSLQMLWVVFIKDRLMFADWRAVKIEHKPKLPSASELLRESLQSLSHERRWLIEDLYRRSDKMRGRAQFILFTIVSLIIGGVVSIFLAGDLVSNDAQQQTRLEQMNLLLDGYETDWTEGAATLSGLASDRLSYAIEARILERSIHKKLALRSPQLSDIVRKYAADNADVSSAATFDLPGTGGFSSMAEDSLETGEPVDPSVERKRLLAERVELVRNHAKNVKEEELLSARQTAIATALNTLEEKLTGNVDTFLINATPEPADRSLLIASSFTRFGLLLVVIFLVQILVGVYRYSLRLSAFYAARADAIIAMGDRKSDLGGWGHDFLPMDIDFGRQPATPAQYVVDIVDAYVSKKSAKASAAKESG